VAAYLWASLLSVGAIVLFAVVAGHHLLRQARLARLKNDFIATVTHELKTPLASVRLFAETLREGRYEDPAQAARYLDLLVRENERLSRLIDNFLSFSRMERNKRAFELAPVAPADLVRTAAEAVGPRFEADGCTFEVDVQPGLPPIMADSDALVTVLLNLLDNAWKYTGAQKRIALRAYAAQGGDGQVCFEVEDNGIGMTRREARRAFDRFYQADSSLSRSAGGCGLGLSIVKFIVDAHGGSVGVRTEPGKGSTFTVRLPAAGGLPVAGADEA
jgi:signal transduction histidine kinase